MIKSVDQKSANDRGLGAVRVCNMYDGNHVMEEITDWDEQGRHYKIKVTEGTLPMRQVVAEIKVEKVGDANKSKLIADMTLKAKYGLLGKIMERLIIKPLLGGAVGNLFAGVEHYDKTGQQIGKGFKAKTPALVV